MPFADQVRLPDKFPERARSHPCRERRMRQRALMRSLRLLRIAEERLREVYFRFGAGLVAVAPGGAGALPTGARIWNGSPDFPFAVTVSLCVS